MDGIIDNLENAIQTWNEKLAEIWTLLTQSPQDFKVGGIWDIITEIHGALLAIGLALLVLFFVYGVANSCTNLTEIKRPEHALKLFLRFAITRGLVVYGMDLMVAIIQGITSTIMTTVGIGNATETVLPQEIINAVNDCGFLESIPLWGSYSRVFLYKKTESLKLSALFDWRPR